MFDIHTVEIEWAGRPLKIETGHIARQADGAVLVSYGETTVLATVVAEKAPRPGLDFFPLTVNYQEKTYAAGKIPGGFLKREGRPSEKEVLVSRLIDRPIRPLFDKAFRCETQIIATVLSHDLENDPDIVAMVAVSGALAIANLPFKGPIGGARVGLVEGAFVLNPTLDQMEETQLDLVVAGTRDAVLMVESEAEELSEDDMLKAVMFGHEGFQPVIAAIEELVAKAAKEPRTVEPIDISAELEEVRKLVETDLREAYSIVDKMERHAAVDAAREKMLAELCPAEKAEAGECEPGPYLDAFKKLEKEIVRGGILETGTRIDGRKLDEVRPIESLVGVLPRTHGSALFTRGETQALVVTTLGTGDDEQFIDALEGTYRENFLL
ncbi:MAG TPA: polyribonucleotide nucleotidyltransferase, partial [Thermopetrobacter sp.]|nr:polyribonucleotide nucleotidyltransferase [Thermopetrobacter sp.]